MFDSQSSFASEYKSTTTSKSTTPVLRIKSLLGASKGKYIVVVATPLVGDEGQFRGALAASVILGELSDQYLNPLKISDSTRIYIINQSGEIVSSPIEKLIGVNYLDYLRNSGIPGGKSASESLFSALTSGSEGRLRIVLPNEREGGKLMEYLIAYAPVTVGNQNWIIGIATPITDALEYLTPFYFKNFLLAGLSFLAFLIVSIRISKIKGYEEGIETEHKLHSSTPTPES